MARQQLVQLLKDHGVRAWAENGNLYAVDLYADGGGVVHDRVIELTPTLKAVRKFLGY